jgi:carboxyl-terminal processing protease
MRKFFHALLLVTALLFTVAAREAAPQPTGLQARTNNTTARESSPAVRRKTFAVVWETVKKQHYDAKYGGVDWDGVRARYEPMLASVETDAQLHKLLNRMLAELRISHFAVVPAEAIEARREPPGFFGLRLNKLGEQLVVAQVAQGSPAERAGLRPGFVLASIDGADAAEVEDPSDALAGAPGSTLELAYLDAQDARREVKLERAPWPGAFDILEGFPLASEFEARRLEGGVGYVRFTQFIPSLNPKIRGAVAGMAGAPGIIIDLRGNSGGDDSVGIKLAGMFFDRPTQLMITRRRTGDDMYYKARPRKKPYLGPLVILLDEGSGSSSEQFAAGMQESGRAFVVGKRSAGDDLDASFKKLPTGAVMLYAYGEPRTPKGVVIEGRGVEPDIDVDLTRAGLLQGHDAQLEAALKYVREHATKPQSK